MLLAKLRSVSRIVGTLFLASVLLSLSAGSSGEKPNVRKDPITNHDPVLLASSAPAPGQMGYVSNSGSKHVLIERAKGSGGVRGTVYTVTLGDNTAETSYYCTASLVAEGSGADAGQVFNDQAHGFYPSIGSSPGDTSWSQSHYILIDPPHGTVVSFFVADGDAAGNAGRHSGRLKVYVKYGSTIYSLDLNQNYSFPK